MTGPAPMLDGKTVLIAGVGKGLGREIAEAAIREGASVVLGARTIAVVEDLANNLDPSGERTLACRLDVTDHTSCADFAAAAALKFGHVDVLVNLAALDTVFGGVQDANWDDWHKMIEVNLFGGLYMVEASFPTSRRTAAPSSSWAHRRCTTLPPSCLRPDTRPRRRP